MISKANKPATSEDLEQEHISGVATFHRCLENQHDHEKASARIDQHSRCDHREEKPF